MNDTKDIQLLSLVFVYAFDLNIKERFRVYADACRVHDVLRQTDFVGILDLLPFLLEVLIVNEMFEFVQLG